MNFEECFHAYIRSHSLKDATKHSYTRKFMRIAAFFDETDLNDISMDQFDAFFDYLRAQTNIGDMYKNDIAGLLFMLLHAAEDMGYYSGRYPKRFYIKTDNKRIRVLSVEEAQTLLRILAEMKEMYHDIVLLALMTGMRKTEILTLKGSQYHRLQRSLVLLETKNGSPRTIPLTDQMQQLVEKYVTTGSAYLFPGKKPNSHLTRNLAWFRLAVRKAGLNTGITDSRELVVFHTLRHTFATWLLSADAPLTKVSQLLGHHSTAITDRYTHLTNENCRPVLDLLPNLETDRKK